MKKILSAALCFCILLTAVCAVPREARAAGEVYKVGVDVTFGQTEARTMLDMINSFRGSNEAWYWNSDNSTKTELKGTLNPLKYDYELEKAAMQRAVETALSFSHTRPDGGSCFDAYPSSLQARGENIAAGQTSAQQAFTTWREDEEPYSGQGHRRNMLDGQAVAIGIGHVVYQGIDYWTQEFSFNNPGTASTAAKDDTERVEVEISEGNMTLSALVCDVSDMVMKAGDSETAPVVSAVCDIQDHWTYKSDTTCTVYPEVTWTSSDGSVAKIENGILEGVSIGTAQLTASFGGMTVSFLVTVSDSPETVTVSLDKNAVTVNEGKTAKLTATLTPSDYSGAVNWSSDNESVATVDSSGLVKAVAEGTARITVTAGPSSATCDVTVKKKDESVTVSLNITEITIGLDEIAKLNAEVAPSDYSGTVTWSSDNESVATVDEYGYVTPVAAGTANIKAAAGSSSAVCKVTVRKETDPVSLSLDKTELTLKEGGKAQLTATLNPSDYSGSVTWSSDNESVATVSGSGLVTAAAEGTATITVSAGSLTAFCAVTVGKKTLVAVEIYDAPSSMEIGFNCILHATVTPEQYEKELVWSSDNENAASVDSHGRLIAKTEGTAIITASAGDGSDSVEVTVLGGTPASSVSVDIESLTLREGDTKYISAFVEPSDFTGSVLWLSEDESIAVVDEAGRVTGVAPGTVKIKAVAGALSAECTVTVRGKNDVMLKIDPPELQIDVGNTGLINLEVTPLDYSGQILWSSDNTNVVTVDNTGMITAKAEGTAIITASTADVSASCTVKVRNSVIMYSGECGDDLTWTLDSKGVLTVSGTGDMYNLSSPEKASWYAQKSDIESVNIQSGATSVGKNAFRDCDNLAEVSIPDTVENIGDSAFKDCDALTNVKVPGGTIGDHAFESCDELKKVTLGDKVTEIGDSAFAYCENLKEANIPGSVGEIGDHAFAGSGIKKLTFTKDGTTVIDDYAFSGCSELTEVSIPVSVTAIGDNAFDGCGKLAKVVYGGTQEQWNKIAIGANNEPLLNAEIKFTGSSDHTPGDINGDGTVNNKDIIRLMRYLSGDSGITVVAGALDVNGDGTVNNKDLIRLMKYIAGADVELH